MEIVFQSHHARVSERMRDRARIAVQKLGRRLNRAVDAVIRFEEDGPTRRVEIMLHAPRRRPMIAQATGKFFGPALATAVDRLEAQARKLKPTTKSRARRLARV